MESRGISREVPANRPYIIIKNKTDKICFLADVAITSDKNVIQKKPEKRLKYKDISIEIQRMLNMKCFIPVKLSLSLTKHHAMKTYCGSRDIDPHIL
jgi:hypothetical protein